MRLVLKSQLLFVWIWFQCDLIMGHLVVVEVAWSCESLATNPALVRLFSAVNSPGTENSTTNMFSGWSHLCVLRLELVEKPLLQMLQMCGFSPVCVLMCLFNRLGRSKDFPQTEQGSMVFSRGRLVRILIDLQLLLWHYYKALDCDYYGTSLSLHSTSQDHLCGESVVGGRAYDGWVARGSQAWRKRRRTRIVGWGWKSGGWYLSHLLDSPLLQPRPGKLGLMVACFCYYTVWEQCTDDICQSLDKFYGLARFINQNVMEQKNVFHCPDYYRSLHFAKCMW